MNFIHVHGLWSLGISHGAEHSRPLGLHMSWNLQTIHLQRSKQPITVATCNEKSGSWSRRFWKCMAPLDGFDRMDWWFQICSIFNYFKNMISTDSQLIPSDQVTFDWPRHHGLKWIFQPDDKPWPRQVQLWLPVAWLQQPACVAQGGAVRAAPESTWRATLESLWDVQAGDGHYQSPILMSHE